MRFITIPHNAVDAEFHSELPPVAHGLCERRHIELYLCNHLRAIRRNEHATINEFGIFTSSFKSPHIYLFLLSYHRYFMCVPSFRSLIPVTSVCFSDDTVPLVLEAAHLIREDRRCYTGLLLAVNNEDQAPGHHRSKDSAIAYAAFLRVSANIHKNHRTC